jgi:hypothetical protein
MRDGYHASTANQKYPIAVEPIAPSPRTHIHLVTSAMQIWSVAREDDGTLSCAGYFAHPTTNHAESISAPVLLGTFHLGVYPLTMKKA